MTEIDNEYNSSLSKWLILDKWFVSDAMLLLAGLVPESTDINWLPVDINQYGRHIKWVTISSTKTFKAPSDFSLEKYNYFMGWYHYRREEALDCFNRQVQPPSGIQPEELHSDVKIIATCNIVIHRLEHELSRIYEIWANV